VDASSVAKSTTLQGKGNFNGPWPAILESIFYSIAI
jgi:hypothetical protein